MRLSVVLLVWSALLSAVVASACGRSEAAADSVMVEGPADFRAVVAGALSQTRRQLPMVADCVEGFTIRPDWELDDRARYSSGVIDIRVPATAPRIEEVVVHEIAHHLDATCDGLDEVRPEFLATQDSTSAWDSGPSWEETPAEQFAEALTFVVLGRQRAHNVRVSADAVDVVRRWGTATD
jgi:hypothetical protein